MDAPRITDEAVEAAAKAACETAYPPKSHKPWDEAEDWEQDAWRATTRAALEAALPHLALLPMPTREQIAGAIERRLVSNPATRLRLADDVLALLSGGAS